MICYLDSSALVKRYVAEAGSELVARAIAEAAIAGTAVVTRAEVTAALARAVRLEVLPREEALTARQLFSLEWYHLARVQVTEGLIDRAAMLGWQHGLRGYDSVQLAAAVVWQDALGDTVTLAAFDLRLWQAAQREGLMAYPPELPQLLAAWRDGFGENPG